MGEFNEEVEQYIHKIYVWWDNIYDIENETPYNTYLSIQDVNRGAKKYLMTKQPKQL